MKRVLIIDDNADFGRMLRASIEDDLECEVTVFENGERGLVHLENHGADLVITDLLMPGKDGLELIMDMRKRFSNVAVFAVSGGGDFDTRCELEIAEKLGARGFCKPLPMGRFLSAVRDVLAA
ncbi:response regulator [Verrucomicrobia bacterium]|jgi:DNA-binding NtrC family response regulator|nr:response regulator [Verrucomicrobiota bacterium]MDB4798674.1 response regulator [Verrucomicrobiota bacterium]